MNRLYIGIVLIALAAVGTSGYQTKSQAKTGAAQPKPAQSVWIRTPIGSSEMTVEFPGKAKETPVPLEAKVRASYDVLETISFSTGTFAAFASYAASKAQAPINIDGAARGALDRVKNQADAPDYKETITKATVLGFPARRIACTFSVPEPDPANPGRTRMKKLSLLGVIFTDRTRMWQVICTGQATPQISAMATRVVGSVKKATGSGL